MADDYPGILSHSLEEEADPKELSVERYKWENSSEAVTMPYSDRLLTINVFDDGPISPKSSHTAPDTTGIINAMPYLEEMFSKSLAETEKAVPEKLLLLLERYAGNGIQLPAHEDVDDTVYGSLATYRKEIIDELQQYVKNHSVEELDIAMLKALELSGNKEVLLNAWTEIKAALE
ncbi:MAG: hypothetical protein K6F51_11690 [Acetatifactor sp.]|nr:hypothetical protein [Acetatifactor sp.]